MNKKYAVYLLILAAAVILLFRLFLSPDHRCYLCIAPAATSTPQNTPAIETATTTIYEDSTYHLKITFPKKYPLTDSFQGFYHLPPAWRSGVTTEESGDALASIIVKRIENGDQNVYPRYFDSEVRISASKDKTALLNCYNNDQTARGSAPKDITLNGVPFKEFEIADAAMMQYLRGKSLRTIRDGACIAVEALTTGSNYRDPSTVELVSEAELATYETEAERVARGITFTP